ncbi:cold-shock DNA-binding domain protein [Firmicutes bacterium CAG:238]|nr:cold-shock DNA-binding domain protein [Firmicutes bacterium CAG:238]
MEEYNINQHSEKRFFDLMDRLVEWQKHENREPLELLSISVLCNHTNSNKLFHEILIVGYINNSENDIKRAMMSNGLKDKAFIEEMNEWFMFGNPIGGSYLSYYQTCSFDSRSDLSDVLSSLEKKCIEKYNNASINFSIPNKKEEGGCYIATCVYGSYDCSEVWTLRRFRDYKLASSWLGRSFIHTYYVISPTIVRWFGKTKWFNHFWKGKLDRMANHLQKKGYQDTPYYDR